MCAQAKFQAEAMAANSTVRRALAAVQECEKLLAGNQITKAVTLNSSSWLFEAPNDTVYEYLMSSSPLLRQSLASATKIYCFCYFHVQKVKKEVSACSSGTWHKSTTAMLSRWPIKL